MSKAAAIELESKLRDEHTLPHGATIEAKYQKTTSSIEVWAEVRDNLSEEQEAEVYDALTKIVPETFRFSATRFDVDNGGLLA